MACLSRSQQIALCALTACALNFSALAMAEDAPDINDQWLDARFDWVLYLEPTARKNLLDYPGSGVRPVTGVNVAYRVNPRFLAQDASRKAVPYEELFYHKSQPIGLRRFSPLPLKNGWQGAIRLTVKDRDDYDTGAFANAIVRMTLDAQVKNCATAHVLVPPDLVLPICTELRRFNFYSADESNFGTSSVLFLVVSSGVEKERRFVMYRPPGRG